MTNKAIRDLRDRAARSGGLGRSPVGRARVRSEAVGGSALLALHLRRGVG